MRLLFEIDTKDYDINGDAYIRPSSRCITIRDDKIAMVHSIKYNYYKFPGGGIEENETNEEAMIRETAEEAGLIVVPESVKEFGYVHRIQKLHNGRADHLIQENYYYICDVEPDRIKQTLDDYEADERFTLEWVEPDKAIDVNRTADHGPKDQNMLEREARVLEILREEGYFDKF